MTRTTGVRREDLTGTLPSKAARLRALRQARQLLISNTTECQQEIFPILEHLDDLIEDVEWEVDE